LLTTREAFSEQVRGYLEELRYAVEQTHGGPARWLRTVGVTDYSQGKVVWAGTVDVFGLDHHPDAKECFAWGVGRGDGNGWDVTTMLAVPPISAPELAVKAALAVRVRRVV
jgi:hypothetical protein